MDIILKESMYLYLKINHSTISDFIILYYLYRNVVHDTYDKILILNSNGFHEFLFVNA